MSNNHFLPDNYEAPKSGGGFTILEAGDNRLRILSSPLLMWVIWADGKPSRVAFDPKNPTNKPAKGSGPKDSVKHGWGLIVWNYKTEKIEVFELDKQEVIASLTKYATDKDWGHPKGYDVVISKTGSGMDTSYSLVCKPHSAPAQNIVDAFIENPIDLSKLLTDETPFLGSGNSESTTPAAEQAKTVTPENWTDGDEIPIGHEVKEGKLFKKELPF